MSLQAFRNTGHPVCTLTTTFLLLAVKGDIRKDKETAERCEVSYEPEPATLRNALHCIPGGLPRKGSGAWVPLFPGSFIVLLISLFLGCFSLTYEVCFSTFLRLMKSTSWGSGHV